MTNAPRSSSFHARATALFGALLVAALADARQELPLYEGAIPNEIVAPDEEAIRDPTEQYPFLLNVSRPTLTVYLPQEPNENRAAVVVLPGGAYRGVSIVKEGHDVARALNDMGVAAFVLKYRTPSARHMTDRTRGPLQDAQEAIHLVRQRADQWNVDAARVGILGFSAGGHLAATVATHFDRPVLPGRQPAALRPDFLILVYPVISMADELRHAVSRQMLLGDAPSEDDIVAYSAERAVTPRTPAALLIHAADDASVPVGNSIRFFEALQAQKIPAQLIVYPRGGHRFGLNNPTTSDRWIERTRVWLESEAWIAKER